MVYCLVLVFISFFFFFNDTATTEIYTLSLHDALPISLADGHAGGDHFGGKQRRRRRDRKSTRLNSSHLGISYAVFCLKKKKRTHPSRINRHTPQNPSQTHADTNRS